MRTPVPTTTAVPVTTLASESTEQWAEDEFASARLGDARRTVRLVAIASQAAISLSGALTKVFAGQTKELGAAYDFMENHHVKADAILEAQACSTAHRAKDFPFVYCAIDGSSLKYQDDDGTREMGPIGAQCKQGKGLKTMMGLAISPTGVPIGLLGACFWTRDTTKKKSIKARTVEEKETKYWHMVSEQSLYAIEQKAPVLKIWYQFDREADSVTLLQRAAELMEQGHLSTIRSCQNRNLRFDPDKGDETEPGGKLAQALEGLPTEYTYELDVPAGPSRKARAAHLKVGWKDVTFQTLPPGSNNPVPLEMTVVVIEEQGTCPENEKPIQWILLTTREVESWEDACQVIYGYSLRWRIEQFHEVMKERGVDLEESQLSTVDNVKRWVAINLAVASRVLRVVYLSRQEPALLAKSELNAEELGALALLKHLAPESVLTLTLKEAVAMLAKLGGHVGNPEKRPIGYRVVVRGFRAILPTIVWMREFLLLRQSKENA